MSYRTFKRLLGETSLERKCRLLFGLATLCLITISFVWYGWSTEGLAYDQAETTGRLAASNALIRAHFNKGLPLEQQSLFDQIPPSLIKYDNRVDTEIIRKSDKGEKQTFVRGLDDPEKLKEDDDPVYKDGQYVYHVAIRASESCLKCHRTTEPIAQQERDLLGVVEVKIAAKEFNDRVHGNRAILISTALVSSLLLMTGSWLIVRYVIVKPVKHLKEVSDAITAGNLNIRSEIMTGDEFEDLSHAYNRMLRSLMDKEDELRRVNSDLNKTVDELAQANLALHTASQLKGDFLATMSHELRTPLSSIIGFSELLTSGNLTEKQRKWLENIHGSGKHLLNLLNDVLELAKIEAGKMQIRMEEFSFRDLCDGAISLFRQQADTKRLALESEVDGRLPLLHQDPQKLRQILLNLLSNAIKFTPEGGKISIVAELENEDIVIHVADTGIGISLEDQETVFEKFRQSSQVLTREQGGSGLGLSISKELAKLLGGDITLQSTLGQGTTFTLRLPVRLDEAMEIDQDGEPGLLSSFNGELRESEVHQSVS
jgi:two-component system sensor histidine kinase BarA